jgi:hypothetical protein
MDDVVVQLVTGSKEVDSGILAELEQYNYIVRYIEDTVCFFQIVTVLGTVPVVRAPGASHPQPRRPIESQMVAHG